jgi:hypothetical protein
LRYKVLLDVLAFWEDPLGIWLGTVRIMGDYCEEEGKEWGEETG